MITDQDINKLAKVFATKDDLQSMESNIRRDMATKDDLQSMESNIRHDMATKDDITEIRQDMKRFATKDDLKRFANKEDVRDIVKESTESIVEGVRIIIDMLGETSNKTEQNTEEVQGHRIAIGDHEERIRLLEQPSQI